MIELTKEFWENRYQTGETGWNIGYISTPLKEYIDQLTDKSVKILIPGCGNAYEAEYLFKNGFKNIYLIDISPSAITNFSQRVPDFPAEQLICADFFEHQGTYDLIFEQTFFCAISPSLRNAYATKMSTLLKKGGKLVGLLFNDPLNSDRPPFGGNREEYLSYFKPYFDFKTFETATNSIPERKGRELFINLIRK